MKAIEILIEPDGSVKIDGIGFEDASCKTLTAALEKALGDVTDVKLKPEYRQTRAATRKIGA